MSIPVVISTQNLQIQGAKYLKTSCHLLIFFGEYQSSNVFGI